MKIFYDAPYGNQFRKNDNDYKHDLKGMPFFVLI